MKLGLVTMLVASVLVVISGDQDAKIMTQQQPIVIATAAGTGDAQNPLGTNAEVIQHAIEAAYSEEGVLVLMDLGSAIMSAEAAVEMLDAQRR